MKFQAGFFKTTERQKGYYLKEEMMTATDKKGKKKAGKKAGKHAVKSDMLMSEDMEQTLLSEHAHRHGNPPNKNEFYHKKISPHPDKK